MEYIAYVKTEKGNWDKVLVIHSGIPETDFIKNKLIWMSNPKTGNILVIYDVVPCMPDNPIFADELPVFDLSL